VTRRTPLNEEEAATVLNGVSTVPVNRGASPIEVVPIEGKDLEGRSVRWDPRRGVGSTLLLFLSTTCDGCRDLFAALEDPREMGAEPDTKIILLFRSLSSVDRAQLKDLARGFSCVESQTTWEQYKVAGPPFFTYIDPHFDTVGTEGVAWGPESVASAVEAARAGTPGLEAVRMDPGADLG
jgi:hypothetical protein